VPKVYSPEFRKEMILKLTSPRGPSVHELAAKVGIHQTTLSRWLREATTVRRTMADDEQRGGERPSRARRPEDLSPEEKLRIVQQASRLEGAELGAFLRREGVHEADLQRWQDSVEEAAIGALSGRRQRTVEQKRIRKLESELRRKEKALAEAAALLVLEKKAKALWGDHEDDDTTGSNDE
jgi:transposase-like protein